MIENNSFNLLRFFDFNHDCSISFRKKKSEEFESYVYTKPWCRAQPYLVGFVLGYVMYKTCHRYYNKQRNPRLFWVRNGPCFDY